MTADPKILGGKPVVRGTRIAVSLVLEEFVQNPDIRCQSAFKGLSAVSGAA